MVLELRKKTDVDFLYLRLKSIAGTKPRKSKRFIQFVMDRNRGAEQFHHVFCSYMGMKTTDYLGVGVQGREHNEKQDDREWLFEQIPKAVENLLLYCYMLEDENQELKKRRGL